MVKRKGVNSRKRIIQRKKKVAGSVRKMGPLVLMVTIAIVAFYMGISRLAITPEKVVTAVKSSKLLSVRTVKVKGNRLVDTEVILTQCGFLGTTGLLEVNSTAVSAALARNPWIENARCIKRFWGKVVIEVKERVPVAMINAGEVLLVDRYGRILPVEPNKQYDLPLVNGLPVMKDRNGMRYVDSIAIARVTVFFELLHSYNPKCYKMIPQFDMSSTRCVRGYALEPPTIVEMDYSINREQFENLRYMLKTLATRSDVPECINAQYQNLAFVTTKRKSNDN